MSFAANSRYARSEVKERTLPDGRIVRYLARRFVPDPAIHATLAKRRIIAGDRLDALADQYFGDPTQFWRVADGNPVLDPGELVETPGAVIVIPYPLEVRRDGDA